MPQSTPRTVAEVEGFVNLLRAACDNARINTTLLDWIGLTREQVVGRRRFTDLLTIGGKLYHETHFAPLLRMQGDINGIALELKVVDGARMPVLVTSTVKTGSDCAHIYLRLLPNVRRNVLVVLNPSGHRLTRTLELPAPHRRFSLLHRPRLPTHQRSAAPRLP